MTGAARPPCGFGKSAQGTQGLQGAAVHMRRIEPLDWQRGLLAFSIMIYHLTGWHYRHPDSGTVLGRLGIYGVSMFFVLSGLSMALVYSKFIRDGRTSIVFFIRRIFRIWPLLWVAVAMVTVGGVLLKHSNIDWLLVLLNLTTLFGFVSPSSYVNTGAWSIGNEMVYYALTPGFIWAYNRRLAYGNLALAMTTAVGVYFASYALTADAPLATQWSVYINPFNNLFLYCAGIAIYYNVRSSGHGNAIAAISMLMSVVIFCFYPASGDLVNIVVGPERAIFCLASVLLVIAFYNLAMQLPRWLSGALSALGVATYGVYLLHPIVHSILVALFGVLGIHVPPLLAATLTVIATVGGALVSYRVLEAPLIRLGRRITSPRVDTRVDERIRSVHLPGT